MVPLRRLRTGFACGLETAPPSPHHCVEKVVESAWFELESRALLAGLASDQPERVLGAVSIVCRKKLFREQFSPAVAKLLDHPLPKIRVAATLALGVLEARNTFDDLLEALEDDDVQDVRTAVWRTLRRLTGKNLPLDSGAWK